MKVRGILSPERPSQEQGEKADCLPRLLTPSMQQQHYFLIVLTCTECLCCLQRMGGRQTDSMISDGRRGQSLSQSSGYHHSTQGHKQCRIALLHSAPHLASLSMVRSSLFGHTVGAQLKLTGTWRMSGEQGELRPNTSLPSSQMNTKFDAPAVSLLSKHEFAEAASASFLAHSSRSHLNHGVPSPSHALACIHPGKTDGRKPVLSFPRLSLALRWIKL